jgi:hypothetical protein
MLVSLALIKKLFWQWEVVDAPQDISGRHDKKLGSSEL